MKEFIESQGGIILTVLFVATAFNLLLSGVAATLDFIKDKTPTNADNKAAAFVHKLIDWTKWLTDLLSANRAH